MKELCTRRTDQYDRTKLLLARKNVCHRPTKEMNSCFWRQKETITSRHLFGSRVLTASLPYTSPRIVIANGNVNLVLFVKRERALLIAGDILVDKEAVSRGDTMHREQMITL